MYQPKKERPRRLSRVMAPGLVAGLALSACVPEKSEENRTPVVTEIPTNTVVIPDAVDDCELNSRVVLTGYENKELIRPKNPLISVIEVVDAITAEGKDKTPEDFVNAFFDHVGGILGESLEIVLDESLDLDHWEFETDATTTTTC